MCRYRWLIFSVFILSSVLNYLDRQTLAALAPLLRVEFQLTNQDYGFLLTAFSLTYATCAPFAGLFVDALGLRKAIAWLAAAWSAVSIATGLSTTWVQLLLCRAALGVVESGGVPATGKAITVLLKPHERALGNALSQLGLSAGAMMAPPLAIWLAYSWGWRYAFIVPGVAGFLWVLLWWATSRPLQDYRCIQSQHQTIQGEQSRPPTPGELLRRRFMWRLVFANILSMIPYTLWSNWTTVFLVDVSGLSLQETAYYAWIPPLAANAGGLLGGWLSMRLISRSSLKPPEARIRVCKFAALAVLLTAAIPAIESPLWAITGISWSFFWTAAFSVNLYTVPLDLYGAGVAAFATSLLTSAYGFMQAVSSPAFGFLIDHYGFQPVCVLAATGALIGYRFVRSAPSG